MMCCRDSSQLGYDKVPVRHALLADHPAASAATVDADQRLLSSYYVNSLLDMPLADLVRSWKKARAALQGAGVTGPPPPLLPRRK